ncbi:MAG: DUF2520 domain-containing protein [Actinomycetota bacterium]|nr:DUF2520 domain-containing protein [Actinomycetota bacterium]
MDIAVIGSGRVGTALAVLLARAGHRIVAVSGRSGTAERAGRYLAGVPVLPALDAASRAELVLVGTPDDRIAGMVSDVAGQGGFRRGQVVAHLSGATGLGALAAAAGAGARTMSLHPLQTFPTVDSAIERLPGSGMAVTATDEPGYVLGERLAADAGARAFRLPEEARPLYHAAAVFASNYVVTVLDLAERLFREAGIEDPAPLYLPLVRATLDNVESIGADRALTGPAVRGDAGTIGRNLEALSVAAPDAIPAYVALARVALDLAEHAGRLPPEDRRRVEEALARWR